MRTYSLRNLTNWLNSLNWSLNHIWQRTYPFKALIAIFWDLQPLWTSSLTKPDLLRFRCSSIHVLSKTKSVAPHFFYISDITNSSSFNGKIFRTESILENFLTNVLKWNLWASLWTPNLTRTFQYSVFAVNKIKAVARLSRAIPTLQVDLTSSTLMEKAAWHLS